MRRWYYDHELQPWFMVKVTGKLPQLLAEREKAIEFMTPTPKVPTSSKGYLISVDFQVAVG
jgi:hypothetical protein